MFRIFFGVVAMPAIDFALKVAASAVRARTNQAATAKPTFH